MGVILHLLFFYSFLKILGQNPMIIGCNAKPEVSLQSSYKSIHEKIYKITVQKTHIIKNKKTTFKVNGKKIQGKNQQERNCKNQKTSKKENTKSKQATPNSKTPMPQQSNKHCPKKTQ